MEPKLHYFLMQLLYESCCESVSRGFSPSTIKISFLAFFGNLPFPCLMCNDYKCDGFDRVFISYSSDLHLFCVQVLAQGTETKKR